MKHLSNGNCPKCDAILSQYATYAPLAEWFKSFQAKHPEAHISCAGRGRADQEAAFKSKASKAHYGQSSHNYGAALDIFEMGGDDVKDIYERKWYKVNLAADLPDWICWYGAPGASFPELPHVEVRKWKQLRDEKKIKLVE